MTPQPAHSPFEIVTGGIAVQVKLTPKSSANRIDGVADGSDGAVLKVRVTAVAEKGKANAALIKLLAKSFDVAKGRITVVAVAKDRHKRLLIADGDAADFAELQARVARASAG